MRRLARVDLLILDDFALRPLDATDTSDFYELIVERRRKAATIVSCNREPSDWLTIHRPRVDDQRTVRLIGTEPRSRRESRTKWTARAW